MTTSNYNKGEWSELYSFIKLLRDGKIYAADENANKLKDLYLPIIKIIREETPDQKVDYYTGETIKIYKNNKEYKSFNKQSLDKYIEIMLSKLFAKVKTPEYSGAFSIPELDSLMQELDITKVKASSAEKIDLNM